VSFRVAPQVLEEVRTLLAVIDLRSSASAFAGADREHARAV